MEDTELTTAPPDAAPIAGDPDDDSILLAWDNGTLRGRAKLIRQRWQEMEDLKSCKEFSQL